MPGDRRIIIVSRRVRKTVTDRQIASHRQNERRRRIEKIREFEEQKRNGERSSAEICGEKVLMWAERCKQRKSRRRDTMIPRLEGQREFEERIDEQFKRQREFEEQQAERRREFEEQAERRRRFNRFVNIYLDYYKSKAHVGIAIFVVKTLCDINGTCYDDMPKYSTYNDNTNWYEAVSNWLVRVNILPIRE